MRYKYIFFDVANTLLYKEGLYDEIVETLRVFGVRVDKKTVIQKHKIISEIISTPNKTSKKFYQYFNSQLLYLLGVIPGKDILENIYGNCINLPWKKFSDTVVLKDLNINLGIISNWDSSLQTKLRELFDFEFDKVISSSIVEASKPKVNIFIKAFSATKHPAKEILYIGDSIKLDIEPALKVGFQAVLIDRDNIYPYFNGIKIKSLYEIRDILKS